jgi:DNA-directed RNA polymerase specialized sigma24 family protein
VRPTRDNPPQVANDRFPSTQLSLVRIACLDSSHESREALATLCRLYWYPLYAFVRREGHSPDEAQDLTQAFFARLLEKKYLRDYERDRGRFRSFLLAALKHFLANERDRASAQKRGGGVSDMSLDAVIQSGERRYNLEPRSELTPDKLFARQWALTVLDRVISRLQVEFDQSGKGPYFERMTPLLAGDETRIPYAELAGELHTTEGALKTAVHRLRRRYREILRDEIAQTVVHPNEVQEEIRYLVSVLM